MVKILWLTYVYFNLCNWDTGIGLIYYYKPYLSCITYLHYCVNNRCMNTRSEDVEYADDICLITHTLNDIRQKISLQEIETSAANKGLRIKEMVISRWLYFNVWKLMCICMCGYLKYQYKWCFQSLLFLKLWFWMWCLTFF